MENEHKCPICGKAGIPDYHAEDTVCPQCGSDLSIYRVVDRIPSSKTKINFWKPLSIVALLAVIILAVAMTRKHAPAAEADTASIVALTDSIDVLNNRIGSLQAKAETEMTENAFIYIVRRGDSFWKISERFYGTGMKYEQIAKDNDLPLDAMLAVGDTLKIK